MLNRKNLNVNCCRNLFTISQFGLIITLVFVALVKTLSRNYMKISLSKVVLAVLFLTVQILSQTDPKLVANTAKEDEEFKVKFVEYIRETGREVETLRSSGNRLLFTSEVASILWEYDEKEARSIFLGAMNDVRQQFSQFSSEVAAEAVTDEDSQQRGGFLFGRSGNAKFQRMLGSRQSLAFSLAEFDPQTAVDFFFETRYIITNQKYVTQIENADKSSEGRLIQLVAEKDPAKALAFAKKTIEKGVNYNHIELLRQFHKKDSEKANELAIAMLDKLRTTKSFEENMDYDNTIEIQNTFLTLAVQISKDIASTKTNKTPLLSSSQQKELADFMAKQLLKNDEVTRYDQSFIRNILTTIEQFSPANANQIRLKYKIKNPKNTISASTSGPGRGSSRSVGTFKVDPVASGASIGGAPIEEKISLMSKIGTQKLTSEDKVKIREEIRETLAKSKRREEKLLVFAGIVSQLSVAGEKDLAKEVIEDSGFIQNQNAKNYMEFGTNLMLSYAYADVEPAKSFEIMESTIFQINDFMASALKILEFVDANDELFSEGEIQLGIGPAGNIVREISTSIPQAKDYIKKLAKADFERTKTLADKFQRPEARFLARMIILRSLVKAKEAQKNTDELTEAYDSPIAVDDDDAPPPIAVPTPRPRP
jgi:hypothetical protein